MQIHLLTIEEMEQDGDEWTLTPTVPLDSLSVYGSTFMMPMAGDALELHYPDGRVVSSRIVSFGVSVWRDSDGAFYMPSDPAEPALTLTISGDSRLADLTPGVEVWLSDAKFAPESDAP